MTTRIDQLPNAEVIAWPTDSGRYRSGIADGASAVAHIFDTGNTLANAAAKLLSLRNNTSEKLGVLADGSLIGSGLANRVGVATTNDANADTMFSASGTGKKAVVIQAKASPTVDVFMVGPSDGSAKGLRVQSDLGVIIRPATGATYTRGLAVLSYISGAEIFGVTHDAVMISGSLFFQQFANLISFGGDAGIGRAASGVVGIQNGSAAGAAALQLVEMTAPAAPAANGVRLYAEDNGSGKTRLMAVFASGAAQQLAIEP